MGSEDQDRRSTSGQTGADDVLEDWALSDAWSWEWGLVSRGDGMCWGQGCGLLVGGDVSVGFGLRGGGVRGVGDGGNAVRQGS